ncbi:hypothetical protein JOQ06_027750 [Pogonophryne albipinna]|uniref:Zona pellucida sperm-binding protein 3 n=1 Tax=Pogonophryne albipinna TaxID=1090488 RepID=A0AAD6A942_9TELE|nr:hypothetical protein JOQ06_027750 [Pogonophryne albipinna]
MVTAARPASVALLSLFGFADAIRTLRDGPMIDAEGREYKTAGLQDCGSKVTTSKDSVINSNKLIIVLVAGQHGIKRTTHAVVPVSCHYKRTKFEDSQQPPLSLPAVYSTGSFSLKLMTEDWTGETLTSTAVSPDPRSAPRYYFIENHGCFNDAKEEGSNALFNPRTRSSFLQLQLNAFLFPQDTRNSICITCQLKATSEMQKSSLVNKACNSINSRWINVDGSDDVCRCCDDTCSSDFLTGQTNLGSLIPEDLVARETVTLGPLMALPYK